MFPFMYNFQRNVRQPHLNVKFTPTKSREKQTNSNHEKQTTHPKKTVNKLPSLCEQHSLFLLSHTTKKPYATSQKTPKRQNVVFLPKTSRKPIRQLTCTTRCRTLGEYSSRSLRHFVSRDDKKIGGLNWIFLRWQTLNWLL